MKSRNETDTGDSGKTIPPGIEPVEVAVLLSLIFDGMSQIRPDLKMILESRGIDGDRFSHDVRHLMTVMITTPDACGKTENSKSRS
jgi:hypothetical protein